MAMLKYSWNFDGFTTTSSTLFTASPTAPAAESAALIIIHHIIALASDPLACFITLLSLGLLGLNLMFCSMTTLSCYCDYRDI